MAKNITFAGFLDLEQPKYPPKKEGKPHKEVRLGVLGKELLDAFCRGCCGSDTMSVDVVPRHYTDQPKMGVLAIQGKVFLHKQGDKLFVGFVEGAIHEDAERLGRDAQGFVRVIGEYRSLSKMDVMPPLRFKPKGQEPVNVHDHDGGFFLTDHSDGLPGREVWCCLPDADPLHLRALIERSRERGLLT